MLFLPSSTCLIIWPWQENWCSGDYILQSVKYTPSRGVFYYMPLQSEEEVWNKIHISVFSPNFSIHKRHVSLTFCVTVTNNLYLYSIHQNSATWCFTISFKNVKSYGRFWIIANEINRSYHVVTFWKASCPLFTYFFIWSCGQRESWPKPCFMVSMATWGILHWHNESQLTW